MTGHQEWSTPVGERPDPVVETVPDADTLAARAAARLLERLAVAQAEGRVPAVALTGGSVAERLHRELARQSAGSPVDWSRVELWWGDERYVAATDPDRNAGQVRRVLLDDLPVDPARVHEVPASDGPHTTLTEAAAAYAEEVRTHGPGGFDVVLLGMGPDGHIASLFPGYPQLDAEDTPAIGVPDSPKPPPERVTLTFGALNRSRAVWFLVTSEDKAGPAARALRGADRRAVPAAGVRGLAETVWFLDEPAASHLDG